MPDISQRELVSLRRIFLKASYVSSVNAGKIEKTIVEGNDISEWMLPFQRNDILNIRDIEQGWKIFSEYLTLM